MEICLSQARAPTVEVQVEARRPGPSALCRSLRSLSLLGALSVSALLVGTRFMATAPDSQRVVATSQTLRPSRAGVRRALEPDADGREAEGQLAYDGLTLRLFDPIVTVRRPTQVA
jgi:hypothetical protein